MERQPLRRMFAGGAAPPPAEPGTPPSAAAPSGRIARPGSTPLRVALVDDDRGTHRRVRELLRAHAPAWKLESHFRAQDALQAIPAARPDAVLLAVLMPGVGGIECLTVLKQRAPALPVAMHTACLDPRVALLAVARGANGYLVKPTGPADLVRCLTCVTRGKPFFTGRSLALLLTALRTEASRALPPLSGRQHEIMTWVCQGLHDKDIARKLGIAFPTVHAHLGKIYRKLVVHTRSQAAAQYASFFTLPR